MEPRDGDRRVRGPVAEAPGHFDVCGQRTGGLLSLPVVMADYPGERYLVAILGQSANWSVTSVWPGRSTGRSGTRPRGCARSTGERDSTRRATRRCCALEQLFDNAARLSAHEPRPAIGVGGAERGGTCSYVVRDNGVDFDMSYAEKLFAPFQRVYPGVEFPGIRIGLSLARRADHRQNRG